MQSKTFNPYLLAPALHLHSTPSSTMATATTATAMWSPPIPTHPVHTTSMPYLPFFRRRCASLLASSTKQSTAIWTPAPVSLIAPATTDSPSPSLFHLAVDLADAPDLATSHTAPGQYLQLRIPSNEESKPAFLAIASPPVNTSGGDGEKKRTCFEFLVKKVPGSTAERICGLRDGDVVELGAVMGKGFEVQRISPPETTDTVLIFATGSGISAIRSLIESGFIASERTDVRLYYGARNIQIMAYQDRFNSWESIGVKIIPVLSQPDDRWTGERGYVQHSFLRAKQIVDASLTGAVLCGHKQMLEDVTTALVADGVSKDKILKNF